MEHSKQPSLHKQQKITDMLVPSKGNRNIPLSSFLLVAIFSFCVRHGQSNLAHSKTEKKKP